MSKYTCLKNLIDKELKYNDTVIFKTNKFEIEYKVDNNYLFYTKVKKYPSTDFDFKNDIIFTLLKIDKVKIARKEYKYKPYIGMKGCWPESELNDYNSLTRLVIKIYKIIEEIKNKNKVKIFPDKNRFKFLDI